MPSLFLLIVSTLPFPIPRCRGFFPARVLVRTRYRRAFTRTAYSNLVPIQRTFLKSPERKGNIPIHAIGLSLYESLPGLTAEQLGAEVIRTQWL